ncbi:dihydroorotate dehydrogenase [bacterium]|nr:dihydroorotate dehydrogenase [bacterium]
MTDLSVRIAGLALKNPVLTASGTFGYGTEYAGYFDISLLGGIATKTVTLEPREGNPMPRLAETPGGMLNSIGLANVGIERFLSEKLPALEGLDTRVIVNVAGNTAEEYAEVTSRAAAHPRVDAIEVNVSCPNVRHGGLAFGTNPAATAEVTAAVRAATSKPVIVKLTPNVTDITEIARAAEAAGADALSLINTVLGMAIDIETRRPLIARRTAGLSGPAIKPIAIAKVYQVRQAVKLPLIGIGGIMRWQDAVEFLLAGATAVQTGTLHFVEPDGPVRVVEGIRRYSEEKGVASVTELVGALSE